MKRHVHGGHVKWIVSAMRSLYHIIQKMIVRFWMCDADLIALTLCCKLISFLYRPNICCFISKFNKAYRMPNILVVTWPMARVFSKKFLPRPLGFPKTKLCSMYQSWSL